MSMNITVKCEQKTLGRSIKLAFVIISTGNYNNNKMYGNENAYIHEVKGTDLYKLEFKFNGKKNTDLLVIELKVKEINPIIKNHKWKIFSEKLTYEKELMAYQLNQWHSINSVQSCCSQLNIYMYKFDITVTFKATDTMSLASMLYGDTMHTDFELLGEDGGVMVHRMCLGVQSPMLAAMLDGDWKEAKAGRVELKGVTKETLNHMKAYIYLKKLPTVVSVLQQLLELARYFIMSGLVEDCLDEIAEIISEDQMKPLLEFAFMFDNVQKLQ